MVTAKLRYGELRTIALEIMGDTEENRYALDNLRKGNFPMWRSLIAYFMHQEGYSLTAIGDCLNRNHSTVGYLIKNIESVLGLRLSCNRDVIDAYDEFEARIEAAKNNKTSDYASPCVKEVAEVLFRHRVEAGKVKQIIENTKRILYESEN